MGKGAGSAPTPPDPVATSNAQTASNIATARKQAELNRVNQVGPTGSVTYSQGGTPIDRNKWLDDNVARERASWNATNPGGLAPGAPPDPMYDASGGGDMGGGGLMGMGSMTPQAFNEAAARAKYEAMPTPDAPGQDQWTQTTKLAPEQQRLYDLSTQAQTTYGEIGNNQLNAVKGALSQPDTTDYEAVRRSELEAQLARLNPQWQQQEEGLRSRLINQGLTEGSEGWNRAFTQFNQGRNDARTSADLSAGQTVAQRIAQTTALRSRPLNEVAALLTGQQVQTPQAYQPGNVGVAPTDVIGAYNNQYQGQLAAYNAAQQSQNAATGGLFGLAGTLGGAAMRYGMISDARLKRDIERIGTTDNGLPWYSFQYLWDDVPREGLMAQDLLHVKPSAVYVMPSGFYAVDYAEALSDAAV
jgi:hypothetical protein